jgi:hypothetical protein
MSTQTPELPELPFDPFWLEHQKDIRKMQETIKCPQTKAGEGTWNDALNNPVFKVFNRIHPFLGSLISVMEYEQVGREEGRDFFSGREEQRIVLRALNLTIEDSIKFRYGSDEKAKYEDYRKFFENMLGRFRATDSLIQEGRQFPNFVNSLFTIFIQEVNNLKGVENFNIDIERIRRKITDYLPQLKKIDEGRILEAIIDKMPSEQSLEVKQERRI